MYFHYSELLTPRTAAYIDQCTIGDESENVSFTPPNGLLLVRCTFISLMTITDAPKGTFEWRSYLMGDIGDKE